jgi:hypothetical protein
MIIFVKDRFNTYFKSEEHAKTLNFLKNILLETKNAVLGDYNIGYVDVFD